MPAPRTIDWGPILDAARNRAPHESMSDVARRFGVGTSNLSRKLAASPGVARSTDPCSISPDYVPPVVASSPDPPPTPVPPPQYVRAVVRALGSVAAQNVAESLESQISQFQQDIASDVAFARERFRTYLDSGDARLAAVGVELWDRAIKHGRLNLGLPSEVIATDNRNARVVSITQASSTRRLL